jgi:CHAT domain-containing protein/tetratricopeptide (TPR) repeat protein
LPLVLLLAGGTVSLCYEFWPLPVSHAKDPAAAQTTLPRYDPSADPEFQHARNLRKSGHLAQAIRAFDQLARAAHAEGNPDKEARLLLAKGSSQLRSFGYRDAACTYFRVIELAGIVQDPALLGAAYVSVAEIHVQLGDLRAAEREARQAVNILNVGGRADYLTRAEMQLAPIEAGQGHDRKTLESYRNAVGLAENSADSETEARAWTILGDTYMRVGDLSKAEAALLEAYRLGVLHHGAGLVITRAKLAELEWMEGDAATGLRRLDDVLRSPSPELAEIPAYQVLYRRAQMLAALSRKDEALHAYRQAVKAASRWRIEALPRQAVNADSVAVIHSIFADASDFTARLSVDRCDSRLRRESLEILAANRAADLRERRKLAWQQDGRLPAEYYKILDRLRTAEASAILTVGGDAGDVDAKIGLMRADLELIETRLSAASDSIGRNRERIRPKTSLIGVQQTLEENDALFSFSLGVRRSWLWVLTRHSLCLYQLGPGHELESQSAAWASAVRSGRSADEEGSALFGALFGQVPPSILRKRNWIVVPDGSLFVNVPLAALPVPDGRHTVKNQAQSSAVPLIEAHTVRSLSSEYALGSAMEPDSNALAFAGIGDPIYNLADPRLTNVYFDGKGSINTSRDSLSWSLGRLVGSGKEVRSAAAMFTNSDILTGSQASTDRVRSLVEREPAIIHFAVHVISPEGRPENAALALTMGKNRMPELLTPELIDTFHIPGSLVVLSGCDSQQGKAVPGVGVQGLGRAWLLAGASAVIASTWPTPDDAGAFFHSFYSHMFHLTVNGRLSAASIPQYAATALAETQNEMRTGGGYRQAPSFWAAYTVMSKE